MSTLLHVYILAGASVDVLTNKSDVLQGIFFQDQEMKDIFSELVGRCYVQVTRIAVPSVCNAN